MSSLGNFQIKRWTHFPDSWFSDYPECVSCFRLSWTALWSASRSQLLPAFPQSSSLISSATAAALLSSGAVDYCLHVLKSLLEHWKSQQSDDEPVATSQLLKPHTTSSPPDMSPFFLRQYVKVRAFPGQWAFPSRPRAPGPHSPGAVPKEPRCPLVPLLSPGALWHSGLEGLFLVG